MPVSMGCHGIIGKMQNVPPTIMNGIDALSINGYAICEDFLPAHHIKGLAAITRDRHTSGAMQPAGVGKNHKVFDVNIRGDHIHWLEESDTSPPVQAYFLAMQTLKIAINRTLMMGLDALETHLALYPSGSFYQKHLDQFRHASNPNQAVRLLSTILYLNETWQSADGGALRLYTSEADYIDIAPTAGKLVLFLSHQFPHEVLPVHATRISLTGWFKSR